MILVLEKKQKKKQKKKKLHNLFLVFRELKKKRKRLLSLWFPFGYTEKKFLRKKKQKGNLFMVFRDLKKKKKREKAFVPLVFLVTREKNFKGKNTKRKKPYLALWFSF